VWFLPALRAGPDRYQHSSQTPDTTGTGMRSHYCGGINESHIDQEVTLCGWVHRRRDHGGVIFLDLRDRDGISQVVIDPDTPESFALAEKVRSEFVVQVTGRVRRRPAGTENSNMPTGQVELLGKQV